MEGQGAAEGPHAAGEAMGMNMNMDAACYMACMACTLTTFLVSKVLLNKHGMRCCNP